MPDPFDLFLSNRSQKPLPLSAFLLGFHCPDLRRACQILYGEDELVPDFGRVGQRIDRLAFEVMTGVGAVRYSDLKVVLDDLIANFETEVSADVGNLESFGERREIIIDILERVEILCERSVESDEILAAWRAVGYAIGAMISVLTHPEYEYPKERVGKDLTLRRVLMPLEEAVSRLPKVEATAFRPMLPKILPPKPHWLADVLVATSNAAIKYLNEKYGVSASTGEAYTLNRLLLPWQSVGKSAETSDKKPRIPRSAMLALNQYLQAASALGDPEVEDKKAYEWLVEEGISLKAEETWCRYLRNARPELGMRKNLPRTGRSGRSIVRADEV